MEIMLKFDCHFENWMKAYILNLNNILKSSYIQNIQFMKLNAGLIESLN